jgi:flagellar hook-associated protein 2
MSTSLSNLTGPITFTGQSKFAESLQQVIQRAVGIASLPLASDQATLSSLNARQSALQSLDNDFSSLQGSIGLIETALQSNSLATSVSDGSVVKATLGADAAPGTYSIHVDSLGAYSTALSQTIDTTDAPLTLTVDGAAVTIMPASDSLSDLASAINTQSGGLVQAAVVNVGPNDAPDYRLSLTAAKLGAVAIDLSDSSGSLIAESQPGSAATYEVQGSATVLSSDSRTVTLAPGLTVDLLGASSSSDFTTVTVKNDASSLASAFGVFAQAYNRASGDLARNHGQGGGALEGDSLIRTLNGVLQRLAGYSGGTPETSLANFGISVDTNGQLSVDTAAFAAAANANFAGLTSTLGGVATGGFLLAATNALGSVNDLATGSIQVEEDTVRDQIASQNTKIADEQAKIALLQSNLTAQIVKADAAISALESQLSYVNGLFYSITGNNNNPNGNPG